MMIFEFAAEELCQQLNLFLIQSLKARRHVFKNFGNRKHSTGTVISHGMEKIRLQGLNQLQDRELIG